MATGVSGSMSTNSSTYIVAAVDYSETYDVATNASSVTASLWYRRTNNYAYPTVSPGTFYVNINGTNYSVYSGTFTIPGNDNNWHKVGEKTVTGIAHNADGSKSITIGGSHSTTATNVAYLNFNLSKSVALTTIPRASKPTVSTDTLVMGNSLQIDTHRASSSFTHTITVTCGGHSVTYNNVGTSVQFVAGSSEWMPYMTSKSMTATVSCTTYNGSTKIGSAQSTSFTLNVDTSVYKPLINSVAHEDTNDATLALTGNAQTYVKGKSILSVTVSLGINNTDYNSTLASASIATAQGTARNYTLSGTSQTITFSANGITSSSITVTVTDNRGVTATRTINLTLIPYDVPRLSAIETKRVNASDQESETGTFLKYKLASNVFWGTFGDVANSLKIYSRYKLPTDQNYSAWTLEQTIQTSGTGEYKSYEINGTCSGSYSSASQFDIQIMAVDELGDAYLYAKLMEGIPVVGWGADHFDVYGTLHVHDRSDILKYLTINIDSVETVPVNFSGADGGVVNWTVFKFGAFRIAVCQWRSTSNYAIDQTWGGMYYSNNIYTPNFPVSFSNILYQSVRYTGADSALHAEAWDSGHQGAPSTTNFGYVYLVRPNDGGAVTVGHPRFTELIIGTI